MANRNLSPDALMKAGRERAIGLYRSRRMRITALVIAIFLLLFGLFGFFIAPGIIKSQLQKQLTTQLQRPVSIDAIHLNPYTMRLTVDKLHIGDHDGTAPFIDLDQLVVSASWSSVFHLAPVLDELTLQHPQIHITRTGPQTFNFTDILQRFASKPSDPNAPPTHFAVYNISVHNGDISFDDKVQNATHRVDQLELGVPFITNLPHGVNVFVQPLLAMRVDGSALRIQGQTKPFASSLESVISFNMDHLDLAKYLAYSPTPLPADIPSGLLSGTLDVHFVQAQPTPQLLLQGTLQLDNFAMTTHDHAPMLELGHGAATLQDVQPLESRYHFSTIQLDHAALHYTKQHDGSTNFDALLGKNAPPPKPGTPPTDAQIDTLALQNSTLDYGDLSGPTPAHLPLENMQGTIRGLSTVSAQPGVVDLTSGLAGGSLHVAGNLFMHASRFEGQISANHVGLQPLAAFGPALNADIASGTLDGDTHQKVDWSKTLALTMDGSKLAVNDFALARHEHKPVSWQSLAVGINHLDLGSSTAQLGDITLHGLKIDAQRLKNGSIDLTTLTKSSPPAKGKQAASPSWHWSIAHLLIDGSTLALTDPSVPAKNGRIEVDADKFGFDNLSDDMHKPIKLDLSGGIGHGKFKVDGNVKPEPADADLRVDATKLNIAPFASLVQVPLNVNIDSALLSAKGSIRYRDRKPTPLMAYQGRVVINRVHVQDKVTGDDFLRWNTLAANGMKVQMGEGAPKVVIGGLALDDFYARVIINANGRINLQDVVSNPAQAPVSVTREQNGPAPAASAPPPPPKEPPPAPSAGTTGNATLATAATTAAPPADIHIGQITLANGNLNYTDNFIKPNYTANITQLAGKIGAFGTDTSNNPADVTLQGELDDNSPVNIQGSINPLTPMAFLDIKATANDVELTHLTPYSGKYAGYPITKGRLTMDVHYQLDQNKLNADNHIVLNQLTFGDRIEGPGISHLPVKLAVALLKDSNGNIDIHVPVSGSLNDPQFSLGGVIWQAFVNLLKRAVTSPFRLLGSIGGGGSGGQDLGYVEFAPGSAVLDVPSQDKLAHVVDVLNKKTDLKLDITGRIDPSVDEQGLRSVTVDDMVQKEEADDIGTAAAKAAPVKPGTDDYNKYLTKAYKHAKFKKPRDLVGLTKSQPPDEMIKMMEANVTVDQDALRHLAERRADAARQYLHGKIADNRVFVLAPKLDAKGIDDKGKTTRDDFGLHM
ncbi:DUF748 domain-containing protein [Dyella nitratireducens]|uniref:DUF748 domain-containing protein n=1 Tax=Dyella nitratireducens TaxID=1849580 RepID=A0ABQ1GLK8_9GAMM|nr:DUF748 domain-containing protein [Dyella nitratireducens]GGA45958.1 hypothetical protein GCM10010981_38860 [Dyella nitratireducens]GLQ41387.1 hypothetical protein GCM10007902_12370 [Dyella nitratireducens]